MKGAPNTTRDSIVYDSRGLKIFGAIHRGTQPADRSSPGVVMFHGFLASKCQPPHRLFVQLAEGILVGYCFENISRGRLCFKRLS